MKRKLINGVTALIISQCIVKILGLAYKLYLANKDGFGDAGNAIYNAGFQIYALLLTISSIGVPNAVAKLVAEKKYLGDKSQVGGILKTSIYVFSVIGSLFSIILVLSAGFISKNILNMEETKYTIIALAPAIFNVCIISVYRGFYNGTNRINITAKSQTIEQIHKTIFTILLVEIFCIINGKCTIILAIVANFATTIATFLTLIYLHNKSECRLSSYSYSGKVARNILKLSVPISISAILSSFNRIIDSATVVRILKRYIGEMNARVSYGVLCGKVDVLYTVPVSFVISIATTIVPSISSYVARREYDGIVDTVEKYIKFTMVIILPCCIGLFVFSDQIMRLLFNSCNGSFLLKISSISMFFIAFEQIVNATLQALGKVFVPALSLGVGVIIKFVLNIVLLNINSTNYMIFTGINGACFATLACHVFAFSISCYVLKKKIPLKVDFVKSVIKPILACTMMIVFSLLGKIFYESIFNEKVAIIMVMITAGCSYLLIILALKILDDDEIKMVPFLSNFIKFAKK